MFAFSKKKAPALVNIIDGNAMKRYFVWEWGNEWLTYSELFRRRFTQMSLDRHISYISLIQIYANCRLREYIVGVVNARIHMKTGFNNYEIGVDLLNAMVYGGMDFKCFSLILNWSNGMENIFCQTS